MGKETKIEWTRGDDGTPGATWNPWTGCTKLTAGCDNCYAYEIAEPKRGSPAFPQGFDLTLRPHKYRQPLGWKEPRRIFVNSMSDMFHKDVPDTELRTVWDVMLEADWHTYQILTKRPHRAEYKIKQLGLQLPPQIWLGVSTETQAMADSRIPPLLRIQSAVAWISAEPLLGPLNLRQWLEGEPCKTCGGSGSVPVYSGDLQPGTMFPDELVGGKACGACWRDGWGPTGRQHSLAWVVTGGESGPHRRPADPDWFRSIRDQCVAAGVAYFHKQGSAFRSGQDRVLDGRTWDEFPRAAQAVA